MKVVEFFDEFSDTRLYRIFNVFVDPLLEERSTVLNMPGVPRLGSINPKGGLECYKRECHESKDGLSYVIHIYYKDNE